MLTKEKLDSWYEPKKSLTEKEELIAEEVEVCDICGGAGEVPTYYRNDDTGFNWVQDDLKPCLCQLQDNELE